MTNELLNFSGRNVVLTGAASGMGAAALDLFVAHGATVTTLDIAPVSHPQARGLVCDLSSHDAIDGAVAQLPQRIDVVVNCAGVPNGGRFTAEAVMAVNWLGLRHLTESLLPRMPTGSAVVHIASTAGRNWQLRKDAIDELVGLESFQAGRDWVNANAQEVGDGYSFSKEVVQCYTHLRALETIKLGIRMNSVCPGVTDTALVDDFRRGVGDDVLDRAVAVVGRMARPAEMAPAMLFLADEASASYINGVNLNVDLGTGAAHLTGNF